MGYFLLTFAAVILSSFLPAAKCKTLLFFFYIADSTYFHNTRHSAGLSYTIQSSGNATAFFRGGLVANFLKTTNFEVKVDGEEIEFSGGFTDLHTESYKEILVGNGFGLDDVLSSIQIVSDIRNAGDEGMSPHSGPTNPTLVGETPITNTITKLSKKHFFIIYPSPFF